MNIGIVGLGLIGGSMARDLKAAGHLISGCDINQEHCEKALDLELVEQILDLDELLAQSDLIIVSVPVKLAPMIVKELLDKAPWSTVIMDTGSTKGSICGALANHKKRSRFVASHPLAGTENSGPTAAIRGLFKNRKNIICEEHLSDEDALDKVISILRDMEMQNIFMDPDAHDMHMAYVSHLSHVSSFMLGTTVLDIEKDEKTIFNLASTGFESTVRLAKSHPETWTSIFEDNSVNLIAALNSYINHLTEFRNALENQDREKMKELMSRANDIKRILTGLKYNIVKLS